MVRQALVAAAATGGGYAVGGIPRNMRQACATYLIARELGMTMNVALPLQVEGGELVRRLVEPLVGSSAHPGRSSAPAAADTAPAARPRVPARVGGRGDQPVALL